MVKDQAWEILVISLGAIARVKRIGVRTHVD